MLAEPLPALARPLVPVVFLATKAGVIHVPDGAPMRPEWVGLPQVEIASIHGRSPADIWLLTGDAVVLHHDGKRITRRYERPCGWGASFEQGMGQRLVHVLVDRDSVRLLGSYQDAWSRLGTDLTATLTSRGIWSCATGGIVPEIASSFGDTTWKLAHNMSSDACKLRATGGPCAPTPSWAPSYNEPSGDAIDMGIHSTGLWMHGRDDGWIVTMDHEARSWLLRYNGVTWAPVAALDRGLRVLDLWADERRHVWITAGDRGKWSEPAKKVLRFDGEALRELPVPESFAARMVRGTSSRDVWFAGAGGKVYQWDGDQLRRGAAPFDAEDMWSSPGGEVWIVGKGGAARTAPLGGAR